MDIVTKLFLANIAALAITAWIDKGLLKDKLEKLPGFGTFLEVWTLVTLLSIPVWLLYIIVTF
jgi:hypothetical protein